MKPILVFGASGFTGRLVVEALLELGHDSVVIGGRSEAKLRELSQRSGGLEYRVADAMAPETLPALVRGMHVVVSTAGPFTQFGEPVVRAALEANAHFLDTTGEQAYMMRILERYHGACRQKRLCVVNAQAFEFGLGYCAAALLAQTNPDVHTIDVFNRVEGFGATRGTQKSGLAALAEDAYIRKGGQLVKRGLSPIPISVRMPESKRSESSVPFPGGEALHLARLYPQVQNVTTNLVAPHSLAALLMAAWSSRPLIRLLYRKGAFAPALRRIDAGPEGPDEKARLEQTFKVLARGRDDTRMSGVLVTGADPYGITGTIAALGAKMLSDGPPLATGVVSTDQAFGAQAFLDALLPFGITVSKHEL